MNESVYVWMYFVFGIFKICFKQAKYNAKYYYFI